MTTGNVNALCALSLRQDGFPLALGPLSIANDQQLPFCQPRLQSCWRLCDPRYGAATELHHSLVYGHRSGCSHRSGRLGRCDPAGNRATGANARSDLDHSRAPGSCRRCSGNAGKIRRRYNRPTPGRSVLDRRHPGAGTGLWRARSPKLYTDPMA